MFGIFKTEDAGVNWSQLASTKDFYYVQKIIVSPNNSDVIYASTQYGLQKSTDKGVNWTKLDNGKSWDVAVVNKDGTDYVYAFVYRKGLIVSTNGGANFTYKVGSSSDNSSFTRGSIAFSKS